jgi:hypothetical protein
MARGTPPKKIPDTTTLVSRTALTSRRGLHLWITRPLPSRIETTVVAWCASSPTYLIVRFMRTAPWCDPRVCAKSMVAPGGVLSICVMHPYEERSCRERYLKRSGTTC